MKRHLAYLKYLFQHKFGVYQAGSLLGVGFWRLVVHDWSKFLPDEWLPYAYNFYDRDGNNQRGDFNRAFQRSMALHKRRNPHHWEAWIIYLKGEPVPLEMPEIFAAEMVADWIGVSLALKTPGAHVWYRKQRNRIILHDHTREYVELTLENFYGERI